MNFMLLIGGFWVLSILRSWFARDWFVLIRQLGWSQNFYLWTYSVLFLPGTIVHEMAHFLTAALLGLNTGNIELLPTVENNQVRLGHVAVEKVDIFRLFLVGIAPLFLGMAVILVIPVDNLNHNWWTQIIWFYLLMTVGSQMMPSSEDLRTAFPVLLILTVLGLAINTVFNAQIMKLLYTIDSRVTLVLPKLVLLLIIMFGSWLIIKIWNLRRIKYRR